MTNDVSGNDTRASVPEGKYEQRRHKDLTRSQIPRETDEKMPSKTRRHTVRVDTSSACAIRVVKVAIDVGVQNQKEMIADLNERLRRLRCR
jgi:hypothetical protein